MQEIEELKLEILRLMDKLAECRAAIKDAAHSAEDTPWKIWWLSRYSSLLHGNLDEGS
jgi:hypothetical protein